ncbi:MAG: 4-hydroxy-3-methylbut-2-enyl diphosphate reductase [Verrucomicrobia bacterium]|nr:4-hydroxy-3-methylbut-2-enyl diphosphate reductase [Verrucomicrobiota bacterium]
MKIIVAKTAGFCMGVRRAVDLVLAAAGTAAAVESGRASSPGKSAGIAARELVTIGPLIHNRHTVEMLQRNGVRVVEEIHEAPPGGTVVIRAHGVPPRVRRAIEEAGLACLDATCPLVLRIQRILDRYTEKGFTGLIVGDKGHAEVVGLLGHTGDRGMVVETEADLDAVPADAPLCVVAQSTQDRAFFERVVAALRERGVRMKVFDTVCNATVERQDEVRRLAKRCDAIVVVGGAHSANTQRLASIARGLGVNAYLVEDADELDAAALAGHDVVGVTAGASTPNWLIEKVIAELQAIGRTRKPWAARAVGLLLDFLVKSDLYVGIGAGLLCFACIALLRTAREAAPPMPLPIAVAACYVFACHILNHFTDPEYALYKESHKHAFLERYKRVLIPLGVVAAATGIGLSAVLGWVPFAIVCFLTLMGLIYSLPIVPRFVARRLRRMRDIPSSKDLGIAGAWAVITVVLPLFEDTARWSTHRLLGGGVAFLFAFTIVFARTMVLDMRDIQGDLMVGNETVPIIIGRDWTKRLLYGLLGVCAAALVVGVLAGWTSPLGLWLLVGPVYALLCVVLYNRGVLAAGLTTEVVTDAGFYLIGVVALVYWLVG